MDAFGERIENLIKQLGITKTKFAEKLSVSQPYISKIIISGYVPSDRLIEDICEKFNANEKWLRTGEGEMFIRKTRSETIADFMVDMLNEEEPSYKRRLIEALAELSTDEWKLLENNTLKLAEKKDKCFTLVLNIFLLFYK